MGEIDLPVGLQEKWGSALISSADPICCCGAAKVYQGEKNVEYLHADYCPMYMHPNWIEKLNKELRDGK